MPNPLVLADAVDLYNNAIQNVWVKGSETFPEQYKQYYNVESGVVDYETKDSSLTGLGYAGRIVENAAVTAASPVQGFDKTYTQVEYGVLMSFSKMVWRFGIKKRKIENIVNEAKAACNDLRELRCAERLDNSFSSTYVAEDISGNYMVTITGGDGAALISASHSREDSGTAWSNRVTDGTTVNMDFEYDALKAAHRTAALIKGPTGKPLNIMLDTLVVSRGYAVANRAKEILGAINKGWIPGSADRDGSSAPAYKIIELPWIATNTAYWWMFDSSKKNARYGLQYKENMPISIEGPNVVFRTGEMQWRSSLIFDIGHNDPRIMVGSKNTNAA